MLTIAYFLWIWQYDSHVYRSWNCILLAIITSWNYIILPIKNGHRWPMKIYLHWGCTWSWGKLWKNHRQLEIFPMDMGLRVFIHSQPMVFTMFLPLFFHHQKKLGSMGFLFRSSRSYQWLIWPIAMLDFNPLMLGCIKTLQQMLQNGRYQQNNDG